MPTRKPISVYCWILKFPVYWLFLWTLKTCSGFLTPKNKNKNKSPHQVSVFLRNSLAASWFQPAFFLHGFTNLSSLVSILWHMALNLTKVLKKIGYFKASFLHENFFSGVFISNSDLSHNSWFFLLFSFLTHDLEFQACTECSIYGPQWNEFQGVCGDENLTPRATCHLYAYIFLI